ncbi:ABC transporter permease [Cryptosporangium aurantiacum]|uniref:Peptide/nickel transport system permease protein n=1 Tax=Cryptosporangium aurantiacum TaxID=134849 RepID=A0A1M7HB59_9ACTN|nr:ABC transporter permease [Cryptosporangium aurantiacum]SHM25553.1 peptide/nickel transport system permease protein [Cryptosporangium aurantiacum]
MRSLDLSARIAAVVLGVLVIVAALSALTGLGGDPSALAGGRLEPPSPEHWLGTDGLGRSELARLLQGIGTTLVLSAVAVLLTSIIAVLLGVVAGYFGGLFGDGIMRVVDVLYSFPALVLAILVAALLGPGRTAALASIVLITVPLMTRMVRIGAASVARRDFVTAARISGVPAWRIMLRHVLPNVAGTVVVQGSYALSLGILIEGGLSFLGYGVQLPQSSLGSLVQDGALYFTAAPWLLFAPGVVLVVAICAINLLGDGLRDRFEPRGTGSLS